MGEVGLGAGVSGVRMEVGGMEEGERLGAGSRIDGHTYFTGFEKEKNTGSRYQCEENAPSLDFMYV